MIFNDNVSDNLIEGLENETTEDNINDTDNSSDIETTEELEDVFDVFESSEEQSKEITSAAESSDALASDLEASEGDIIENFSVSINSIDYTEDIEDINNNLLVLNESVSQNGFIYDVNYYTINIFLLSAILCALLFSILFRRI